MREGQVGIEDLNKDREENQPDLDPRRSDVEVEWVVCSGGGGAPPKNV
jgi:hypothetical protein